MAYTHLFIPDSVSASADAGGWRANANFINDQADATYGRRTSLYVLTEGGGVWQPAHKRVLEGSIIPDTLSWDYKQSQLSIQLTTSNAFLDQAGLQGIYFVDRAYAPGPTYNPHQIENLNLGKIVEHILEAHTNVSIDPAGGWVDTSGIDTTNSTSVDVYTVRNSNSIWQTLKNIADNEFYVRYFTKLDQFIYEPHPQFRAVPQAVTVTFTADEMVAQPEVRFRNDVKTDQMQLYALTDKGEILQSFYPAAVGTEGRRQKLANIRCNSQSRLDLLSQRSYRYANRDMDVTIQLAGSWAAYLELYDRVAITYSGTARNGVTLSWSAKKFWIEEIALSRVGNLGTVTQLRLAEENL